MSRPNPIGHPARFSQEIIDAFVEILSEEVIDFLNPPTLWDPFAGDGTGLAEIAFRCSTHNVPLPYGGTEIEPEFIAEGTNIIEGDATDPRMYPPALTRAGRLAGNGRFLIATSPAYPNGCSDAWVALDESKRFTYQWALDRLIGDHRQLHPNNQGRYGYRGSKRGGKSRNRENYWRVASQAVECWIDADMILLNVSDFKVKDGAIEPLVSDWRELLREYGWVNQREVHVGTHRIKMGSEKSRDQRVEHEVIVVGKR